MKRIVFFVLVLCFVMACLPITADAYGTYGINFASVGYQGSINPYTVQGLNGHADDGNDGECTWFAWGRAYEKLGVALNFSGNATDWTSLAASAGYATGSEARTNSIMVEHYYPYGHVFFVEKVENGFAYVTEGNYNINGLGCYHEDVINLSTMTRSGWVSPMNSVDYIYLSGSETVGATFALSDRTSIGTTGGTLGTRLTVSGASMTQVTQVGVVLYNSQGSEVARVNENITVEQNLSYMDIWYDINSELNYTLSAGTNYKYRFYAVIRGKTYWQDYQSFTTGGQVAANFALSDRTSIGTTGGTLGTRLTVSGASMTQVTRVGVVLYDYKKTEVARVNENITVDQNLNYMDIWYDINSELNYTLAAGTTYKYSFYAVIGGVTYWEETRTVTTSGTHVHSWNGDVCATCGELQAVPVFKSQSLVLSGQIGLNFFLELPEINGVDYSKSYMTFTIGKDTSIQKDSFDPNHMNNDHTRYGFTCYVNSIQMADMITAVFHYGNGKMVSKEYSVAQYIEFFEKNLGSFNAKTISLIQAIADYGHYEQIYLADVNEWTVGEKYAAMAKYYTDSFYYSDILAAVDDKAFDKALGSSMVEKATYKLHLDSETTVDVFLTPKSGATLTASASFNGKTYSAVKQSDGRYLVRIPNISAHQLGDMITITGNSGGAFTVRVSALSYTRSVLNSSSTNKAAKDGLSALYQYYTAVVAYRN